MHHSGSMPLCYTTYHAADWLRRPCHQLPNHQIQATTAPPIFCQLRCHYHIDQSVAGVPLAAAAAIVLCCPPSLEIVQSSSAEHCNQEHD